MKLTNIAPSIISGIARLNNGRFAVIAVAALGITLLLSETSFLRTNHDIATRTDRELIRLMQTDSHMIEGIHLPYERSLDGNVPRSIKAKSVQLTDPPNPSITLMMGFPWSGQSILQKAIHDRTRTSTANNFGGALMISGGAMFQGVLDSVPVYEGDEGSTGPYAFSFDLPFPTEGSLLTRSFCAGHCVQCWPKEYVLASVKKWLYNCGIGSRYEASSNKNIPTYYNVTERVKKVIHLIRDPFTTIPIRFEKEYSKYERFNMTEKMEAYPLNRGGFLKWCKENDDELEGGRRREIELEYYLTTPELVELSYKVPCHTDFFRYIQWHNYAFEAAEGEFKKKALRVLYYEDLEAHPEAFVGELIKFLGLNDTGSSETSSFPEMRYDGEYLTDNEYDDIKRYFELLATKSTFLHLKQRYFPTD